MAVQKTRSTSRPVQESASAADGPVTARLDERSVGVWSVGLRRAPIDLARDAAANVDLLGFEAIWIPGSSGGDVFDRAAELLQATRHVVVATGVVNIWMHTVEDVARRTHELDASSEGRFLLGLGCSHASLVTRAGRRYSAPVEKMQQFLDGLDADGRVPSARRVLAALGPRMLSIASRRAAGVHPFNVTPAHTARARHAMGPAALVVPELKVVLERAPSRAREVARTQLVPHLRLPNYVRNLLRLGFTEEDVAGQGSDRLVDALVAWGDENSARRRLVEHFDAGASHVCLNVLTPNVADLPIGQWKRLAAAVL
jgi:probable F420-dependent oxidoreductase